MDYRFATADDGADSEDVSVYRRQYEDWRSTKSAEIEERRMALRYYHGDQWETEEVETLRRRNQPVVTYNYISQRINSVVGVAERLRMDPKAYPRTPREDAGAELATIALNYVFDANRWKAVHHEVTLDAAVYGVGGVELTLQASQDGGADVGLAKIDVEELYYDPLSMRGDFSDAFYMGLRRSMDVEKAKEMFPDRADEIEPESGTAFDDGAKLDRTAHLSLTSRPMVTIFDHWHLQDGVWRCCVFTNSGVVLAKVDSPFQDGEGRSIPKFRMWSAAVDHQSDRYGFFRHMKSAQDEANHRRSKALHWINRRQVIMDKGAVDDIETTRRELHRPDSMIEVNPGLKFEIEPPAKEIQGNLELLQEAKAELENFGPNDELGGDGKSDQSGRAIQLRQQAGIAKLGPFMLSFTAWKLDLYRCLWAAIRRNWRAETWLRVTDDEGAQQLVAVNAQQRDQFGMPTGRIVNPIAEVDVDIVLDEGPDQMTTMQGTFDVLTQMGDSAPPELMIEMSPLPGSVKKRIMAKMEERARQPDPAAQAAQAQLAADQQAQQIKLQADMTLAQAKMQADAQRAQFEAEQRQASERQAAAQALEVERMKLEAAEQIEAIRAESRMQIEEMKALVQQAIAMNKLTAELEKAHIAAEASIEAAERAPEPAHGYADA